VNNFRRLEMQWCKLSEAKNAAVAIWGNNTYQFLDCDGDKDVDWVVNRDEEAKSEVGMDLPSFLKKYELNKDVSYKPADLSLFVENELKYISEYLDPTNLRNFPESPFSNNESAFCSNMQGACLFNDRTDLVDRIMPRHEQLVKADKFVASALDMINANLKDKGAARVYIDNRFDKSVQAYLERSIKAAIVLYKGSGTKKIKKLTDAINEYKEERDRVRNDIADRLNDIRNAARDAAEFNSDEDFASLRQEFDRFEEEYGPLHELYRAVPDKDFDQYLGAREMTEVITIIESLAYYSNQAG